MLITQIISDVTTGGTYDSLDYVPDQEVFETNLSTFVTEVNTMVSQVNNASMPVFAADPIFTGTTSIEMIKYTNTTNINGKNLNTLTSAGFYEGNTLTNGPVSGGVTTDIFGDTSCKAFYKFDGDATDATGVYNGTATNVTYATGKFGQCAIFNGTSSKITTSVDVSSSNFTFSVWVNPISVDNNSKYIFSFNNNAPILTNGFTTSSALHFYNNNTWIPLSHQLLTNAWTHIVISVSGTSLSLYINGTFINTTTIVPVIPSPTMFIGSSSANTSFFNGSMDQVRIFNRAVTASEVTQLYNESSNTVIGGTWLITVESMNGYYHQLITNAETNRIFSRIYTGTWWPWAELSTCTLVEASGKALIAYGYHNTFSLVSNMVSITGLVSADTTIVGTGRSIAAGFRYGIDKAIIGYGWITSAVSMTNLVSNTGIVSTDTTGVGTARGNLAATSYGVDKGIFGFGWSNTYVSITNLVSNTGIVSTDTTGVGTAKHSLAACSYGGDKGIFGYGYSDYGNTWFLKASKVSNTGIVSIEENILGTNKKNLAACGYGGDKAIFGYGINSTVDNLSITNLVSNTGVFTADITGVGTARQGLTAATYNLDKGIFAYGNGGGGQGWNMTNLVSNTGIVATDVIGISTGRQEPVGVDF